MFSSIFGKIPRPKKPVKLKLICNKLNHTESIFTLDQSNLSTMYVYLKCPCCIYTLQIPILSLDKDSFLHTYDHAIKIESGELKPARL